MIRDALDSVLGESKEAGDQTRWNCPFCEKRGKSSDRKHHLYASLAKGLWICYRCDARGRVDNLLRSLGVRWDGDEIEVQAEDWNRVDEILDAIKVLEAPIAESPAVVYPCEVRIPVQGTLAHSYLAARGIDDGQISYYGIRWGFYQGCNRIFIPSFDFSKRMDYWTARAFPVASYGIAKYTNPETGQAIKGVFNLQNQPENAEVVLVEGVFDAIAAGPRAVALYGKTLSNHQYRLLLSRPHREYVVALDSDAQKEAIALAQRLFEAGQKVSWIPIPAGLDPATDPEFPIRLRNRALITFDMLVNGMLGIDKQVVS